MSRVSPELQALTDHQKQIKSWLAEVEAKISTLEETYLEETTLGNVVRGWEQDGKSVPLFKMKGQEDKEKIFSMSSYQVWLERQQNDDDDKNTERKHGGKSSSEGGAKNKKIKKQLQAGQKRKHDEDLDYADDGDY